MIRFMLRVKVVQMINWMSFSIDETLLFILYSIK